MFLNIREILHNPGIVPFEFELPLSESEFIAVKRWNAPLSVKGSVRNSADILTLRCEVFSDALMICDRCGREYEAQKTQSFEAVLSDQLIDEDNDEIFPISGNIIDAGEIVRTLFVLAEPTLSICGADCEFTGADYFSAI
ncbi:MAG: DUF177 domain-containing protein [Oscillospiraceae bacterium]|jgi:uncharacterized metal-binding protein YceD (DUF177 family)|nr:DUF177 domain-containing protein [Oscillospiraceae bacterium]